MSTLRELSGELIAINDMAKDPDIPAEAIADTIEGIEGMFNEKAVKIVHVLANNDSDISAIDDEIKRLLDRKKVMTNGRDRLKEYLRVNMEATGITKIESDLFTITLAKGRDSVVVDDMETLPDTYKRVSVSPDKIGIGKALKDGADIPGAHFEKGKSSVRIK